MLNRKNGETKVRSSDPVSVHDEIKAIIKKEDRFLITTHVRPDGDSLASVLVFAGLLDAFRKSCRICIDDGVPRKYDFLPGIERVKSFDDLPDSSGIGTAVVLDASGLERTGRIGDRIPETARIVNIDHHEGNSRFGEVNCILTGSSSTAEIVYDLYRRCDLPLTPEVARLVYTGIVCDTGCFRFANTGAQTLETAAEMVRAGADPGKIIHDLQNRHSAHTLQALGHALTRIRFFLDDAVVGMHLTCQDLKQFPEADTEGFVNYLRMIEGPSVQFFINEVQPGRHRVSLRSHEKDVNQIAGRLGGGGHARAAGCDITGNLEQVQDRILGCLSAVFKAGRAD